MKLTNIVIFCLALLLTYSQIEGITTTNTRPSAPNKLCSMFLRSKVINWNGTLMDDARDGRYDDSCTDSTISGTLTNCTLAAKCLNMNGQRVSSSVVLQPNLAKHCCPSS